MKLTRLFLAAAALLLAPAVSQASPDFPGEISLNAPMPCPPPCTLCHTSPQGGDALKGNFVVGMILNGLMATKPETVRGALVGLNTSTPPDASGGCAAGRSLIRGACWIDSDSDLESDIVELQQGRNPNLAPTATETDVFVCPPTYGCGARIAPRPPVDGSALACALIVAGFLGLRLRRRV